MDVNSEARNLTPQEREKGSWSAAIVLGVLFLVASIFTIAYLALTGNQSETFTDLIMENVALIAGNKTNEKNLVYILTLGGIVVYTVYYLIRSRTFSHAGALEEVAVSQNNLVDSKVIFVLLGSLFVVQFVIGQALSVVSLTALLCLIGVRVIDKNAVVRGFVAYLMVLYALYGIFRIYAFAGGTIDLKPWLFAVAAALIFLIGLVFADRQKALARMTLIAQCIVPFSLLVFISGNYSFLGETVFIPVPLGIVAVYAALMIFFVIDAAQKLKAQWSAPSLSASKIIAFGACASILMFDSFQGTGAIIPGDTHHVGENIIGFSQIFELGQIPFEEYIPTSGFYSVIHGAFLAWFGGGEMGNYHAASNLMYSLVALLVVLLLWKQTDKVVVLITAILFVVIDYDRVLFILPIMLLLAWPKVIEKRNLWIQLWLVTSLLHGLYYPLFGVAAFAAFFPFGVFQVWELVRSGQLRELVRKPLFWISWALCLILLILALPLLVGTADHMLTMSGQSLAADGLVRFAQQPPDWFFSYLKAWEPVRLMLFYVVTFVSVAAIVWVAYAVALAVSGLNVSKVGVRAPELSRGLLVLSCVILPLICYSYTAIRFDLTFIYSRSITVVLVLVVMLIVFAFRYLTSARAHVMIVGILVGLLALGSKVGIEEVEPQLESQYHVLGRSELVEGDIGRLGTGFVDPWSNETVAQLFEGTEGMDEDVSYYDVGDFGFFYLSGLRGAGPLETMTVKGYEAAQETAAALLRNDARVGANQIDPVTEYYLYRWLASSGDYIWDESNELFVPTDQDMSFDELAAVNRDSVLSEKLVNVKAAGYALGNSFESLEGLFTRTDIGFSLVEEEERAIISFEEELPGVDADFLHVAFKVDSDEVVFAERTTLGFIAQDPAPLEEVTMTKWENPGKELMLQWEDADGEPSQLTCVLGTGELLIPLGADISWLLNYHGSLELSIVENGSPTTLPPIESIEFLKLRDLVVDR